MTPLEFLKAMRKYVTHAHIKDVSRRLLLRLEENLPVLVQVKVAIGEGVNADNIKKCVQFLKETNWDGGYLN